MNKKEFLDRLSFLLSDLSDDEREKAINYYSNYIDEAGEENEEETIRKLGSLDILSRQIRAQAKEARKPETNSVEINIEETKQEEVKQEEVKQEETKHEETSQAYTNQQSRSYSNGRPSYSSVTDGSYSDYQNKYGKNHSYERINNNNGTRTLLMILIAVISFPIWFPILMTVLGLLFGLIVTILAVIFAFGVTSVALIVSGFGLVGVAIWHLVTMPLISVALIGGGVLIIGGGLLFVALTLLLSAKILPACVGLIGKLFSAFGKRKAGRY